MAGLWEEKFKTYHLSGTKKDEKSITPDTLLEQVNKNVIYRPLHGPNKYSSEPLVAKRLYLMDDSVKVVNLLDINSDNVDKTAVQMEESPRKGYVKLREIDPSYLPSDEDVPMDRTEVTPSTSRSSTDSDTTYDYSTLTEIKTPKPIEIVKELERQDRLPNLPRSCIAHRKVKKLFCDLDLEEQLLEGVSEDDLYIIVAYISSKGFMKYFQNNVFPNSLGLNLGFDPEELRMAKAIPGKIFCNLTEGNSCSPCEVIPAIRIQWPHKQTLEFLMKGQKPPEVRKRYIFPTERMINEIKALNSVLVPKGYVKKKGLYLDGDIEWEIQFPHAERYLESFMSHAQAKSYLILLTLHKTYVEPKTQQIGLLAEHIRHFLLWECELNYSEWPEHRLGTKLMYVIKKFNCLIAKRHLPDYFIADKNMFENVPKKYLNQAQKAFHDVLESPVIYFIKSMRNLRYSRGRSFYPPFDFDHLYDILIKSGIELTNPQITSELSIPPNYRRRRFQDVDTQLKHVLEVKRREREIKKRQAQTGKENLKDAEERRESVDSINMEVMDLRQEIRRVQEAFAPHVFHRQFHRHCGKSAQISSHKQTLLYLKQAKYLARILGDECPAVGEEVEAYLQKIKHQEDRCNKRAVSNGPNPPVEQEMTVNCASDAKNSNKVSDSSKAEKMLKSNGVKPRKSVAFVEIH
ncbi:hypothetical protein NQ318_011548 [Aromia moschata]|uniref:Mab-21-like HhH/H2TH-like domain-containing protein n=1 Tax=Aromia moschata TaxID=1265417 RepID=A0AAV8Z8F0_9CUCU|nr:hypothetical protein NQ318_011548 [Aromia moschata]